MDFDDILCDQHMKFSRTFQQSWPLIDVKISFFFFFFFFFFLSISLEIMNGF